MLKLNTFDYSVFQEIISTNKNSHSDPKVNKKLFTTIMSKTPFKGRPFKLQSLIHGVSWSGKTRTLYIDGLNTSGFFHETAHYFLAPDARKSFDDFGLGPGFNTDKTVSLKITKEQAQQEEEMACMLEWLFLYNFVEKTKRAHYIKESVLISDFDNLQKNEFNSLVRKLKGKNKEFEKYGFQLN